MKSSFFCIYFKCFFLYLFHSLFVCALLFVVVVVVVVIVVKVLFGNPSLAVLPLFI